MVNEQQEELLEEKEFVGILRFEEGEVCEVVRKQLDAILRKTLRF